MATHKNTNRSGQTPAPQARKPEDVEQRARKPWTAKGVPQERQEAMLADITAKARPGAPVGPFRIPHEKLGRFLVTSPEPSMSFTGSEAYQILDRDTRGIIAVIYRDGGDGLTAQLRRAKRQADAISAALNALGEEL